MRVEPLKYYYYYYYYCGVVIWIETSRPTHEEIVQREWINPLTPTVAIRVQLKSITCQTGLSYHW